MKPTNSENQLRLSDFVDKTLLIVDDDDPLRGRLSRAMEKKGFPSKRGQINQRKHRIGQKKPSQLRFD